MLRELTGCVHDVPGPLKKSFLLHLSDTEAVRKQSGPSLSWTGSASGLDLTGASIRVREL